MIRRSKRRNLSEEMEEEENVNPMDGVSNMADAMLVLAVGMMLAVVTNWNVDLSQPTVMQELENTQILSEDEVAEVDANKALEELGVVYKDPDTGKVYIRYEEAPTP